MGKLSARKIETIKEAGIYQDGHGLFLSVSKAGSKYWKFRYQFEKKRRDIGLGDYPTLTLEKARAMASAYRADLKNKIEPISPAQKAENERQEKLAKQKAEEKENSMPTFAELAQIRFDIVSKTFRNQKHSKQWLNELRNYAFAKIGDLRIDEIHKMNVLEVLQPIWVHRYQTAKRIKQRIFDIVDYAVALDYREHSLPTNVINKALPEVSKADKHFKALPYSKIQDCLKVIRTKELMSAYAIEAVILTAVRSGEVRGARWREIDLKEKVWTIPAERMKANAEHKVPLSDAALNAFLKANRLKPVSKAQLAAEARTDLSEAEKTALIEKIKFENDLIFEGSKQGAPLSDMTLSKVFKSWGFDATIHGLRSTFRDWIANETQFDGDLAEMALAHTIKNAAERAYRRGNMLEKRRTMMNAWADYCEGKATGENVIKLAERK